MREGKKVILLAEGNADLRIEEKNMFEKWNCIIDIVQTGTQALDYLRKNTDTTDMVVTSLNLPELSGMELLEILQLSNRLKRVPCVMILPEKKIDIVEEVLNRGAEDIILYPIEKVVAARRIHNILMAKTRPLYENIMEEIMEKELDKCIDSLGICQCAKCRRDVLTLSLNKIRPRYVSSEKGRLLAVVDQMSYDYIPEMLRAITESAEIVKKNPHH